MLRTQTHKKGFIEERIDPPQLLGFLGWIASPMSPVLLKREANMAQHSGREYLKVIGGNWTFKGLKEVTNHVIHLRAIRSGVPRKKG